MEKHNNDAPNIIGVDDSTNENELEKEEKTMNVEEEIEKAAEVLGRPAEEVKSQFEEIARQNGLDLMNETDKKLCLALFRQWFGSQRRKQTRPETASTNGGSLVKTGFGVVIGVEDCRDMMTWQREQLTVQFTRSPDEVFEAGKVAVVAQSDDGSYSVSQMHDGEEKTREKSADWEMPDSAMEIEGRWIIPINDRKAWASGDKNKDYGKPLPKEQFVRRVHFIGQIPDQDVQRWTISLKNDIAVNFEAEAGRFLSIDGIWNLERNAMYGVRNQTLSSIVYNDELDPNNPNYRDVSNIKIENLIAENFGDFMSPLFDLEKFHQENAHNPISERMVVTEGVVSNMNMRPSQTGSRTVFVTDLNADFNYDDDGYSSTPCWVPEHVPIDFGIGSHVVIIGRTSQREMDDGGLSSVSINTFGIIVTSRRGNPLEYEDSGSEDTNNDWF